MSDLRDLAAALGLTDVQSLLQTGNLVFGSAGRTADQLERLLEAETARRTGLDSAVFVRTAAEWRAIVARNPFPREAKADPARLVVVTLKDPPGAAEAKALQAAIVGREVVRVDGRQAYIVYPDGMGTSRLTNAVIERKLGTPGTARNWNTALKIELFLGR